MVQISRDAGGNTSARAFDAGHQAITAEKGKRAFNPDEGVLMRVAVHRKRH
jgi:hypothetical protein